VRLKRLELTGFKTFAERTAIEFASQITAIVGPNGSGKSNIFDAIRWALGEGSLRSLRGVRTEDIIFAGTERRRPLGMAEVTLTLDNEDATLVLPAGPEGEQTRPTPLAFAEVTVTRRAMRNAENQPFINGLPCRLRDIQTMFLGTGLGGHSYSLITQGEVEQMLDATPEERRMILEEAAGIAKYKRRRHDAERRMAAAEATLLRVGDILGELEAQTAQLAAQAEAAERYQAQTRELRTLELSLQVEEVRRCMRAQRRIRDHLEELAARRQETENAVRALAEQREAVDRRALDASREWEQIQRSQLDLTERRTAAGAALELVAERLRGVGVQHQRIERELARYRAEEETLRRERADLVGAEHRLATEEDHIRTEVQAAETLLRQMDADGVEKEEQLEAGRSEARAVAEARAGASSEVAAAEAREAGYRDRSAELGARVAYVQQQQDAMRTQQAALSQQCATGASDLEGARGRIGALRADLEQHVAAREETVARERQLEIERERYASGLRHLEEAQAQYRGYDSGAREILLASRGDPSRLPGLKGTVADFLHVPRDLRPAVEAALGPYISALVVSSVEDAQRALEMLDGAECGPVTFAPVSTTLAGDMRQVPPTVAQDPATLGRVVDLVQITGPHPEVIRALLGDVLIVSDLDAALRARANGYRGRVVSRAGDVLTPEGVLITGWRSAERTSVLGRTEDASGIRATLGRVDASLRELGRHREGHGERIREVEGAIASAETLAAQTSEGLAEGRRRLLLVEAEAHRLAGDMTLLGGEKAAAEEEAAAQRALQERARREVDALSTRLAEVEERIATLARELRDWAGARREAASRVTELRITLTEFGGRRGALQTRMGEIDRSLAQWSERCRELDGEVRGLEADAARCEAEREAGRARCEALDAESARFTAAQAGLEDERAALAARRAESEAQHREALGRAAALADEVHKVEVRQAQVDAELGSARRRMEEEFGVPFERAVGAVAESVNREETLGRIEALRGLIAAMGPVNLLAIEEHRQVAERAQVMRAQRDDVQGTIAALRTLILQLEEVIRGHFDETYQAVNNEFADLFARLFGGGQARLELVPGVDGAEPGIEIIAQPPGKKLRSLSALSGGERVMVALALVFAMLRVRPSPFCVFDEVEAALDEPNTRKVSEVLRELAARTQIIIITHNKATMEASDVLFGVTMEEGGVSRLVSMRLVASDELGEPQPVG
jgi:chromosome segregation protein